MTGTSVLAASVRTVFGLVGLAIGISISSSLLDSLEAEMTPEAWASLTETDSFGTIGGFFAVMLTLGLGILFAYGADLVRIESAKRTREDRGT